MHYQGTIRIYYSYLDSNHILFVKMIVQLFKSLLKVYLKYIVELKYYLTNCL